MSRRRLAITLLATLALAACTDGGPTSPSGTGTRDVPGNGPRGNGFPGGVSGGGQEREEGDAEDDPGVVRAAWHG